MDIGFSPGVVIQGTGVGKDIGPSEESFHFLARSVLIGISPRYAVQRVR